MKMKKRWFGFVSKFTSDSTLVESLWKELESKYQESHRAYHNLSHIESLLNLVDTFERDWEDKEVLIFSIWYHDIIYKSTKKDNELQSAIIAQKRLSELNITQSRIEQCYAQILATKTHSIDDKILNSDTLYLLDFDLEILSRDWDSYQIYTQQIRKEYKIYPWFMYKRGRKKAMQHFLERDYIYHTNFFRKEKEQQARANIQKEIDLL